MDTTADDAVRAKLEFIEDNIRRIDLRHASVQAELSKAQAALEHAQRAVECLSAEARSLDAARLSLTRNLENERSALRRAHRLAKTARINNILTNFPPELLRSIFLEATNCVEEVWPDGETWSWGFETEHTILPFTLAAVNRRWRAVALDTPDIWTFLGVRCVGDKNRTTVLSYVKHLLSRSRGRPLDVFLDWTGANWKISNCYKNVLDAVGRHIHRWRRASITFPDETPEDGLHFLRLPMPRLEDFHLHAEEMFTLTSSPSAYLPFCPRLRRLHNFVIFAVPRQPMTALAYVDIQVDETSLGDVWTMLRRAPSVEELHLKFASDPEAGLPGPPGPLTVPNLLLFGIYGFYDSYMSWIDSLAMPVLRTLYIAGLHAVDALSATFDKVADTVTTLAVYGDDDDDIFVTVDDMPSVRRLHQLNHLILRDCHFVGPDMSSLFASREASGLPHLKSIIIDNPTFNDKQAAHVSDLMQKLHSHAASGTDGAISFKLDADRENVPEWLLKQYKFITGDDAAIGESESDDGEGEGDVADSPAASITHSQAASGSESEEAQFTDGDSSGEAYTSDSSWKDSDDDSDDVDETVD